MLSSSVIGTSKPPTAPDEHMKPLSFSHECPVADPELACSRKKIQQSALSSSLFSVAGSSGLYCPETGLFFPQ
jgi:hypothetical protein